jgi:hypothetical protein
MKSEIRLLGIDDAPFSFDQQKSFIIGVVIRATGYLEGVLKRDIDVDGKDANNSFIDMINSSRHKNQIKAALVDGVTFAGFNIINIEKIYQKTNLPIITVTREKPNLDLIKTALQTHFSDWNNRYNVIADQILHRVETKHNDIFVNCAGVSIEEAKEIITLSTIRGVIPEPIRIAHVIASGLRRGESHGKA